MPPNTPVKLPQGCVASYRRQGVVDGFCVTIEAFRLRLHGGSAPLDYAFPVLEPRLPSREERFAKAASN